MRDAIESIEAENKRRVQKRKEKGAKNVFRYFFNLPTIEPFLDWDYYFLRHDLSWYPNPGDEVGDIEGVTVPGGFVSDLASVPRLFGCSCHAAGDMPGPLWCTIIFIGLK